jgi:hypothetical protein
MTGAGAHESVPFPADALAARLGVEQAAVEGVLALPPDVLAANLAITAAEHEQALGNMLRVDDAHNALAVLVDEVDWAAADPEARAAAAVYGLRLLDKLGITFDMGAAN